MPISAQALGRRWATTFSDNDFTATLGNNAGYAQYVHDKDEQASFHQARGWRTVQEVAEQETPAVQGFIESYLQQEINKAGN